MTNVRLRVSIPPDVRDALEEHAAQAGVDVSTYVIAAVKTQMAHDDAVEAALAPLDEANRAALAAAEMEEPDLPTLADLTPDERARMDRIVREASGTA